MTVGLKVPESASKSELLRLSLKDWGSVDGVDKK